MDQADLYIHTTNIKKWDICAGDALLTSLGNNTVVTSQLGGDLWSAPLSFRAEQLFTGHVGSLLFPSRPFLGVL